MQSTDFFNTAKIYHLNAEEINFLIHYSEKLRLDPLRALVNRQIFEKIIEAYKKDITTITINKKLINSLKKKLNFTSSLANTIYSTKDIQKDQKAKFYFDRFQFVPLQLQDNQKNYLLWKALLHRNVNLLKENISGEIIFEERYLIAYKFTTTITEIYKYADEIFVKTPHSDNIIVLAKRRYPRVEVDLEGFVRKSGKLRDNPFYKCRICNISEGGAKICLQNAPFKENEKLILRFKLAFEDIDTESIVEAEITYDGMESYGLKFVGMDEYSRHVVRKFVTSQINKNAQS
ncbi:PilZ domain-containing protein [Nitratiruptor tergarcus]|uniref:Predicted glycosyltransferase n=1 Tax=Nitratiruptor tergarcus DSM 16512 TaxID=1069081 RepID=A0A1W1WUJ3_9BACT|nr:PilZ domain-containing protein [Nitratiruptor tergarcus]SMC09994.1 Predicted glycosyltransferase [Nitratiruptor tergarcus DSM 16512]